MRSTPRPLASRGLVRLVVVGVLGTTAAACGGGHASTTGDSPVVQLDGGSGDLAGLRGDVLDPASAEPAITMTDTQGKRYDVTARDRGKVTLVYFGYTHCPDICPTIMADTAEAIRDSPPAVRRDVAVVFVTVDPRRDTLPVLSRWLKHFDPSFVGLRTSIRKVIAVQRAAGVPVSKVKAHSKDGYSVEHSAELLAFTPDGKNHVAYTDGPDTLQDLKHDLPILTSDKAFA